MSTPMVTPQNRTSVARNTLKFRREVPQDFTEIRPKCDRGPPPTWRTTQRADSAAQAAVGGFLDMPRDRFREFGRCLRDLVVYYSLNVYPTYSLEL